jgi:hypothetical protein
MKIYHRHNGKGGKMKGFFIAIAVFIGVSVSYGVLDNNASVVYWQNKVGQEIVYIKSQTIRYKQAVAQGVTPYDTTAIREDVEAKVPVLVAHIDSLKKYAEKMNEEF